MVLREAPGEDMHNADPFQLKDMIELLIGIQVNWRDRLDLLTVSLEGWASLRLRR